MSIQYLTLFECNENQLVSFGNSVLVCKGDEELKTIDDVQKSLCSWYHGQYLFDTVAEGLDTFSHTNGGVLPFDGDTYVRDVEAYTQRKEEQEATFIELNLFGLGTCKVYPSLDRIVYQELCCPEPGDKASWQECSMRISQYINDVASSLSEVGRALRGGDNP